MPTRGVENYDVMDANGSYRPGVSPTEARAVLAANGTVLAVKGVFALPWLGVFFRNSWAKRQGASL